MERYEKYHSPYDNRSLMARFFDKIYNPMKPLLKKSRSTTIKSLSFPQALHLNVGLFI